MRGQGKNRLNRDRAGTGKELPSAYIVEAALTGVAIIESEPARAAGKEGRPCDWTICRKPATSRIAATTAVSAAAGAASAFPSAAEWESGRSWCSASSAG